MFSYGLDTSTSGLVCPRSGRAFDNSELRKAFLPEIDAGDTLPTAILDYLAFDMVIQEREQTPGDWQAIKVVNAC